MSTSRRRTRSQGDDEARGRRGRSSRQDNTAVVAGGIFVLALVAIGAAGYLNRGKLSGSSGTGEPTKTVDDVMQEASPFSDIAPEEAPTGGGRTTTNLAPMEIMEAPIWIEAQKKANEAYALSAEAEKAKKDGDNETYLSKAVASRTLFDTAIIESAEWEMEIQNRYGDNDVLVKKIVRERSRWFDMLGKYRGIRKD